MSAAQAWNATDFMRDRFNVGTALGALIAGLPPGLKSRVVGACAYHSVPGDLDQAFIISNAHGPAAGNNHASFFDLHLADKRVHLPGTSVGKALDLYRSGKGPVAYLQSGYRADHFCLNLCVDTGGDVFSERRAVIQIVFDAPDFANPLCDNELSAIQAGLAERALASGLEPAIRDFSRRQGGHIRFYEALGAAPNREAFFMLSDITGSSRITAEAGFPVSAQFNATTRLEIMKAVVERFGGEALRSEGDGLWSVFPCTGMSDERRAALLDLRVLPAAEEIVAAYDGLKQGFISGAVLASHMKVGISRSVVEIHPEPGRYYRWGYDGDAFSRLRFLIKAIAPADQPFIFMDSSVEPLLPALAGRMQALNLQDMASARAAHAAAMDISERVVCGNVYGLTFR